MSRAKKVAKDVVVAAATTGAGVALGPAAALAVKLTDTVLTPVIERAAARRKERAARFVEEFLNSSSPSATAASLVSAEVARAPDEVKDAVFASLREIDEAVSEEVVPALALVARECVRKGTPKDRFIVGLLRVLRDLEDGEFQALHHLVNEVERAIAAGTGEWAVLEKAVEPGGHFLRLHPGLEHPWDPHFDALFDALAKQGFFASASGFGEYVQSGWRFERDTWHRLATYFPPALAKK